jgi:hypothetical protein
MMTQGTIVANCGPAPDANAGGVGRHCPTAVPPRNGGGAGVKPSAARHAMIALATVVPHATPAATEALPSWLPISCIETASLASNVAFWVGNSATSAV